MLSDATCPLHVQPKDGAAAAPRSRAAGASQDGGAAGRHRTVRRHRVATAKAALGPESEPGRRPGDAAAVPGGQLLRNSCAGDMLRSVQDWRMPRGFCESRPSWALHNCTVIIEVVQVIPLFLQLCRAQPFSCRLKLQGRASSTPGTTAWSTAARQAATVAATRPSSGPAPSAAPSPGHFLPAGKLAAAKAAGGTAPGSGPAAGDAVSSKTAGVFDDAAHGGSIWRSCADLGWC
jgi:hypothetical protein